MHNKACYVNESCAGGGWDLNIMMKTDNCQTKGKAMGLLPDQV